MRLGDFDALLEKVQFRIPCDSEVAAIVNECVKITKHLIENAPTIDAEPVRHGKWIKTKKHIWEKNDDGEIDEWAWDHEFHNGVCCEICHKRPCVHCEPDYDEKQDCHEHYICSECGRVVFALEPYCHCGAKMRGAEV